MLGDDEELFQVDSSGGEELSEESASSEIEWYDGFNTGYVSGFEAGLEIGRSQGYEDCLYRIKRMAENVFDPEIDRVIKILQGEE